MDEIEILDEENGSSPHDENDSDGDSSTSENEVQLYNLIYHEECTEINGIAENTGNHNQTGKNSEFHISAKSKVFRLNRVSSINSTSPVVKSMSPSRAVRNHIRKVTAKLDAMKQKYGEETNGKTYSKNHFSRINQIFLKNNRNLCGSSIPSFIADKLPEGDKDNRQNIDDSYQIISNSEDIGKAVTEKISTTAHSDDVAVEREPEISKYDIILNGKHNISHSESVIVLDSDVESVDSVIEVKPPTPPPPVVINIDSSDESSQIKEKKINTQKENIDPCLPSESTEIVSLDDAVWVDSSHTADTISSTPPSENGLVVSYTTTGTKEKLLDQDNFSIAQNVNTTVRTKKRKRKSESLKLRTIKPGNKNLSQSVPLSWTSEMIRFYCHSWGGHKFNHEELQKKMPGNSSNWKVLEVDLLGPLPRHGPFKRSRCLNCNQIGHILQQCPEPIREICCCMCGARGHTKRTCPNKICLQCGNPADKYSKGCKKCCYNSQHCTGCGQPGHYKWLCPEAWRIYHSSTSNEIPVGSMYPLKTPNELFCCNCARRGHTSLNCKFPNSEMFEAYAGQSRSQNVSAFNYKSHKNNGYHSKFSMPNLNRKFKKNKRNNTITIVRDSEQFSHKRKKLTNTERKRIKTKQKKVLQNKMANT